MSDTPTKPFLATRAAVVELASTMSFVLAAMMKMQTSLSTMRILEAGKQVGDEAAVRDALQDLRRQAHESTEFLDIAVTRLTDIMSQLGETDG